MHSIVFEDKIYVLKHHLQELEYVVAQVKCFANII